MCLDEISDVETLHVLRVCNRAQPRHLRREAVGAVHEGEHHVVLKKQD